MKKNNNDFSEHVSKLFDLKKELFIKKNQNYGNSWIVAGQILAEIFKYAPTLKTANDFTALSVVVRMLDKLVRYCNLRFTDDKDNVGESISDTIGDLGTYAIMLCGLEQKSDLGDK